MFSTEYVKIYNIIVMTCAILQSNREKDQIFFFIEDTLENKIQRSKELWEELKSYVSPFCMKRKEKKSENNRVVITNNEYDRVAKIRRHAVAGSSGNFLLVLRVFFQLKVQQKISVFV